ncbi:MAG: hypothetical protein ACRDB1_11210 [Microcoleaceae cyanobacterium]
MSNVSDSKMFRGGDEDNNNINNNNNNRQLLLGATAGLLAAALLFLLLGPVGGSLAVGAILAFLHPEVVLSF